MNAMDVHWFNQTLYSLELCFVAFWLCFVVQSAQVKFMFTLEWTVRGCNFASNFGRDVLGKVQILKTSKNLPFVLCCHSSIGIVTKLSILTFLFKRFLWMSSNLLLLYLPLQGKFMLQVLVLQVWGKNLMCTWKFNYLLKLSWILVQVIKGKRLS